MFNFGLNLFLLFFPMKRPVVRMNDVQMTAACVALDRIDQANLTWVRIAGDFVYTNQTGLLVLLFVAAIFCDACKPVVPKLVQAVTQMKVAIMSY